MRWCLGLFVIIACNKEPTDQDRIDAILKLVGEAPRGAEPYATSCASCHGADGSAVLGEFALSGPELRGVAMERVIEVVVAPPEGMLTFDTMPDQEIADIAIYVSGL